MDEYNAAMLLLRVAFGLTMAAHGYAKVFKGGKLAGTAGWFDSIGMKPGAVHARLAAGTEIFAGLGLAIGLLTTFSAMGFVGVMLVAGYVVHRSSGFFIVSGGWEFTFILAVAAVGIAMLGPGEWSVDNALGIDADLDGWLGLILAAGGGIAAGAAQLAIFYRPTVK
ncbi:MAG: DoxX family protein [Acidimicrobiales bacterium]|jgi:putative oxidoreductase